MIVRSKNNVSITILDLVPVHMFPNYAYKYEIFWVHVKSMGINHNHGSNEQKISIHRFCLSYILKPYEKF